LNLLRSLEIDDDNVDDDENDNDKLNKKSFSSY